MPGVAVAFTDIRAGNLALHVKDNASDVLRRRLEVEEAAGIAPRTFQYLNQVHGNTVASVDIGTQGVITADASVSESAPLAIMVADCIPVLLVGVKENGGAVMGTAHAGRPGILNGVIPAAVQHLRERGAVSIRAWLGPSICGRCYEVPDELRAAVAETVPESWSTTSWGTPALDLPAAGKYQLAKAGVTVAYEGPCTLETPNLFSYRRAADTGRFAGLVWNND